VRAEVTVAARASGKRWDNIVVFEGLEKRKPDLDLAEKGQLLVITFFLDLRAKMSGVGCRQRI
jgi:hypothetical protein